MAAINDLISQIEDKELRERIEQELDKLSKQKKFGLVFEEHFPECVPLCDVPVKKGCKVALKAGKVSEFYTVMQVEGDNVYCADKKESKLINFLKKDLVCIAEFGEPIYPCLKQIDSIYKSDDARLPAHALIQADNYHALQLLEYLYAGKADCIYIDPPYNTGARDWKYNNDYVDSSDTYRHSKWLSMMKKRLLLAKKLLNPLDSVMIVTIDEKEYLHLGCLLEELFPEARIQMVSSVINPKGVSNQQGFRRADEYIYFLMFGNSAPLPLPLGNEWSPSAIKSTEKKHENVKIKQEPDWTSMMRRGSHSSRSERPGLYYAIYADPRTHKIQKIGEVIPLNQSKDVDIDGLVQILPIRTNGQEGCWQVGPEELANRMRQGRIRLGKETDYGFVVNYPSDGEYQKILDGDFIIEGKEDDGSLITKSAATNSQNKTVAPTQWKIASHDASAYGATLINTILCTKRFSFPKSLYAVHDAIRFFVASKPNALIVDFFAGSGTTLHAVNLLNAEDGGQRQCIMVTNNEVSDDEAKALAAKGFVPGDAEWEKLGIANYVAWPRTVCSINGKDINDEPLKGNYIGSGLPMADGFKANAVFFKLGFLDKTSVQLGRQFKELLPLLWLKAGGWGKCPDSELISAGSTTGGQLPHYIILPENHFAVLIDEKFFSEFEPKVNAEKEIWTAFIITDFEKGFKSMAKSLSVKKSYQLYRDYLDNFRINVERN